jgi:hypothetical protein
MECSVPFVPVEMRQTGMRGSGYGLDGDEILTKINALHDSAKNREDVTRRRNSVDNSSQGNHKNRMYDDGNRR